MTTGAKEFERYLLANRREFVELTRIQDRELGRLYIDFAGRAKIEANAILNKKTWAYSQQRTAVRELLREASKLTDDFKHMLDKALIESAELGQDVNRIMLKKYSERLSGAGINVDLKRVLYKVPEDTVKLLYNRIWEDGLKLSDRIWILDKRTKGEIERIILEEIASGRPASDRVLDARLNKLLNPDRRGIRTTLHGRNVSFDAARLMRTERTTAFREADRMASMKNPGIIGIEWIPSGEECQVCSDLASNDSGLGPGVYRPEDLPGTPHPQCECYTADKAISSQAFVNNWLGYMKDPASQPAIGQWYKQVYRKAA